MNLDMNELEQETQRIKDGSKGAFFDNFVQFPKGKGSIIVRLMPPARPQTFGRDKNPFYQISRTHRINKKNFHCPRELDLKSKRWFGECEICNHLRWLWAESEKTGISLDEKNRLQNLYRELKAIERYYYNCIVRNVTDSDGKVADSTPKILAVGKTLHDKILTGITGNKELKIPGLGDVTDFKKGYDFRIVIDIKKSGERTYQDYSNSTFLGTPSPASDPETVEAWMGGLHDLRALRVLKTAEEMKEQLQIHLGVKTSTVSSYDPSPYLHRADEDTAEASVESIVGSGSVAAPVAAAAASTSSVDLDSTSLADDDFLNQFNDMRS